VDAYCYCDTQYSRERERKRERERERERAARGSIIVTLIAAIISALLRANGHFYRFAFNCSQRKAQWLQFRFYARFRRTGRVRQMRATRDKDATIPENTFNEGTEEIPTGRQRQRERERGLSMYGNSRSMANRLVDSSDTGNRLDEIITARAGLRDSPNGRRIRFTNEGR